MTTNLISKLKVFVFKTRKKIFTLLNKFLGLFKIECVYVKDLDVKYKLEENLFSLLNDSSSLVSIVFSKDRAMQLHAFLSSYTENISNHVPIFVLYRASDSRHKQSYLQLEKEFKHLNLNLIEEVNFREQLIETLQMEQFGKVLFFVDDMIVTHRFDFSLIEKIDTNRYVLALSRGKDLTYSTVLEKHLTLPNFEIYNEMLYSFDWNYSKEFSDWTFPLGVSGYMFGRKQILAMVMSINFKAPNSLEWGLQNFIKHFADKKGLCTSNAICACVHANLVQTEGTSPELGVFSVDELLLKWEEGKRIIVSEFYNIPLHIAEKQTYTFA